LLTDVSKLLLFYSLILVVIYGCYVLDNFLKARFVNESLEEANEQGHAQEIIESRQSIYKEGVESYFVIIPLVICATVIMIWIFYLRLAVSILKRKKLVWVEV
jgi:hypothetical protein